MASAEGPRSVKIGADERTGWSSERPRRDGPPRKADISTRCKVLRPRDGMRYSPGSLLLIVSASEADAQAFAERAVEQKGTLLSAAKVRELLSGRVAEEELEAKVQEVLAAAVVKRLEANDSVALVTKALDPDSRERFARPAAANRRPRHLILVETARDNVGEAELGHLNDTRKRLDQGELGAEGFDTAMRLGGGAIDELKRIVFAPAPRDD